MKFARACLCLMAVALFALGGVAIIPFHPDETSLLYQSRDFEAWLTHPWSLAWNPALEGNYDQNYRELNAPFVKYVLGLSRVLTGFSPATVSTDWDWSLSWDANGLRGALPAPALLYSARWLTTLLLPLSLALMYQCGRRIAGEWAGILAMAWLGTNSLALLHARRAMAEGTLVLGTVLAMWGMLNAARRPWLAGLGVALAVCSKQSALALFPVGLLAVAWVASDGRSKARAGVKRAQGLLLQGGGAPDGRSQPTAGPPVWRTMVFNLIQYVGVFGLVVLWMNPLFWNQPLRAVEASVAARQNFTQQQVTLLNALYPDQVMRDPAQRIAVMLMHLYVTPPAFYDVGNYAANTAVSEAIYRQTPGYVLMRGLAGGGVMLALTLLGVVLAGLRAARGNAPGRPLIWLALATAIQFAALVAAVPVPIQRYYVVLIPFLCLWSGLGMTYLLLPFRGRVIRRQGQR